MITANQLSKHFGATTALMDVTFSVEEGELFGFIGPDGGGKTTLFRILTSLVIADSGTATVAGLDVISDYKKLRTKLGYMPGRFSLYQDLSVEENLRFFASVFKTSIEENYDLVRDIYVYLEPFRDRRAGQLSGGMKQKLALCCALIHKPEVLFLDEPTTGVDAVSRREFWEMLQKLRARGITIVVSTPYMDEAVLCDRVALIQNGRILRINTPQSIVESFEKPLFAIKSPQKYGLLTAMESFAHTERVYPFGEYLHYTDRRPDFDVSELIGFLTQEGISDVDIKKTAPHIEDCFIALMDYK